MQVSPRLIGRQPSTAPINLSSKLRQHARKELCRFPSPLSNRRRVIRVPRAETNLNRSVYAARA